MDSWLLGLLLTLLLSHGRISQASLLGQAWPGPSHLNLLSHFPVAGGKPGILCFFKKKKKKKMSLSLLLPVCLGYWYTIGLSAWKIRPVLSIAPKRNALNPHWTGSIAEGTSVTVTPGLPQYPTRSDMADVCRSQPWAEPTFNHSCRVPRSSFWGTSSPHTSLFGLSIPQLEGFHSYRALLSF